MPKLTKINRSLNLLSPYNETYFMQQALLEAEKAFSLNEVPVGAVVVCNNQIIGKGHNLTETLNDITAHAEMQAITAAATFLGGKYLKGCTLFVTLEPCPMCAGALYWSQIEKVVFATRDEKEVPAANNLRYFTQAPWLPTGSWRRPVRKY